MSKNINIQQCLHGYEDGHKLLNSSIDIPIPVKGKLLRLSDYSGDRLIKGFESYLTGYPLPEINYYAIAKTWYAFDKSRPGCVWTHTILIHQSDLKYISNLEPILNRFRKPQSNSDFTEYSEEIEIKHSKLEQSIQISHLSDLVNEVQLLPVIFSLYNSLDEILIPSVDSLRYEELILSIWLQIWPKARFNFSFCTGSIENRSFNSEIFDLQIVPISNRIKISASYYSANSPKNNSLNLDEIDLIIKDLSRHSKLRDFLWIYGCDLENARKHLLFLVKLYTIINHNNVNPKELVRLVVEHFPNSTDAVILKNDLFVNNKFEFSWSEFDFIEALLDCHYSEAFDTDSNRLFDKMVSFIKNNKKIALELFNRVAKSKNLGSIGLEYSKLVLNQLSIGELVDIIDQDEKILYFVASADQYKIIELILYRNDSPFRIHLLNIVYKNSHFHYDLGYLLRELFKYNSKLDSQLTSEIVRLDFPSVLQEIERNSEVYYSSDLYFEFLSDTFRYSIQSRQKELVEWILSRNHSDLIYIFLPFFDLQSEELTKIPFNMWQQCAQYSNKWFIKDKYKKRDSIFFLTLGFKLLRHNINSFEFIATSFNEVFNYARLDQLSYSEWQPLEIVVPTLGTSNDWDKCERLRRALVDLFAWDPKIEESSIIQIIKKVGIKSEIKEYLLTFPFGKEILRKIF